MAYRAMAVTYGSLNEIGRAAEYARKAYDLREKVSERERFAIEGFYYTVATGELEKAAQTYELWRQTYPKRLRSLTETWHSFTPSLETGKRHLEESREALRMEPNDATGYFNLGSVLRGPQPAG